MISDSFCEQKFIANITTCVTCFVDLAFSIISQTKTIKQMVVNKHKAPDYSVNIGVNAVNIT